VVKRITCERYCRGRARFSSAETKKQIRNAKAPEFGAFVYLDNGFVDVFRMKDADAAVRDRGSLCIDAVHGGPSP
jgi:hypothetical protein